MPEFLKDVDDSSAGYLVNLCTAKWTPGRLEPTDLADVRIRRADVLPETWIEELRGETYSGWWAELVRTCRSWSGGREARAFWPTPEWPDWTCQRWRWTTDL